MSHGNTSGNGWVIIMRRIRRSAKETRRIAGERSTRKTSFQDAATKTKLTYETKWMNTKTVTALGACRCWRGGWTSRHTTNTPLLRGGTQSGSDGRDVLHVTNGLSIASYRSANTHSSLAVGFFRLSATRGPSEANQKQPGGASGSIFAEQALKPIKRQNQGQRAILASRSQQQERTRPIPVHPPAPSPKPDSRSSCSSAHIERDSCVAF